MANESIHAFERNLELELATLESRTAEAEGSPSAAKYPAGAIGGNIRGRLIALGANSANLTSYGGSAALFDPTSVAVAGSSIESRIATLEAAANVLAIPGITGFGAEAAGTVNLGAYTQYEANPIPANLPSISIVTNLNDSGAGSFRDAVQNASGPTVVIVNVSGAVNLLSKVVINNDYLTIFKVDDGGDGFGLYDAEVEIQSSYFVICNIKFRQSSTGSGDDTFEVLGAGSNPINYGIFYRCTFANSVDECIATNGENGAIQYITWKDCLVEEPLLNQSKGILLNGRRDVNYCTLDGIGIFSSQIRNPRSSGPTDVFPIVAPKYFEWYNIYGYNCTQNMGIISAGANINFESALYEAGPESLSQQFGITNGAVQVNTGNVIPDTTLASADHGTQVYANDVIDPYARTEDTDAQSDILTPCVYDTGGGDTAWSDRLTRFWSSTKITQAVSDNPPTPLGSSNVKNHVHTNCGAKPYDAVDTRLFTESNSGGVSGSRKSTGEYPTLSAGTPLTLENDGITAAYKTANGLTPGQDYDDVKAPDGQWWLLKFLNESI